MRVIYLGLCVLVLGCGVETAQEEFSSLQGKAELKGSSIRGEIFLPFLKAPEINGEASKIKSDNFASNHSQVATDVVTNYRYHRWAIRSKQQVSIVRVVINTFDTFEPVLRVLRPMSSLVTRGDYWWVTPRQELSAESIGPGLFEATIILAPDQTRFSDEHLWIDITSLAAKEGGDQSKVDHSARYEIQLLPVQGQILNPPLSVALDGDTTDDQGMPWDTLDQGGYLEYSKTASLTTNFESTFILKAVLDAEEPTAWPYLQWDVEKEAEGGKHFYPSYYWNVCEITSKLTWTLGEDKRNIKLMQKAKITSVELVTIPLATLASLQAVDTRGVREGEVAPLFEN